MTQAACRSNIALAYTAIAAVGSGEQSIFQLSEQAINRLLICGYCPNSGINPAEAKAAFRKSVSTLIDKLDWYTMEEVNSPSRRQTRLEKKKAYRKAQKQRQQEKAAELAAVLSSTD